MSLEERIKYAEMKTRHQKGLKPWYKRWWGVLILGILGLMLIIAVASSFYVVDRVKEIKQEQLLNEQLNQRLAQERAIRGINPYSIGTNNPEITIVEFADFACPFCQQSAMDLEGIVEDYKDRIKVVFRDYPLHENSIELALAARCAGEQNKFWTMHNSLFQEQDNLTETGEALNIKLSVIAQSLGVNMSQFDDCISSEKYKGAIRADYEDGEKLQIEGTPTWFINNYRITGYIAETQFRELITGLLQ